MFTSKKLNMEDIANDVSELIKRAQEQKTIGKTLNINCMTMSNPPTEEEKRRYEEIERGL